VIVQGSTQSNTSQIVAVYNDAGAANLTLNVKLLYNTFVGTTGGARRWSTCPTTTRPP